MLYFDNNIYDPYDNLAREEYLFRNFEDDIFMLWSDSPCIVIGKNQNPYFEVDMDEADRLSVPVIRRITGGGAVYHDLNNLNFTFIRTIRDDSNTGAFDKAGNTCLYNYDFKSFMQPVVEVLRDCGVDAVLSKRNDIMAKGYKISGNAECTAGNRILHHGTLLIDTDLAVIKKVLKPLKSTLKYNYMKSEVNETANLNSLCQTRHNISTWRSILMDGLCDKLNAKPSVLKPEQEEEILKLRNSKYMSREWTFPKGLPVLCSKAVYGPYGTLEAEFEIVNGCIRNLWLYGDFFHKKDLTPIIKAVTGIEICRSKLEKALSGIQVSDYISGLSNNDYILFLEALKN